MWFEATTWLNIIHNKYLFMKNLCPTTRDFKTAMAARFKDMSSFHTGNDHGVFCWDFQGPDPITMKGKKRLRYYCVRDPQGRPVEMPRKIGVDFMKENPQKVRSAPARDGSSSGGGDNGTQSNSNNSSSTTTNRASSEKDAEKEKARKRTLDMIKDPHIYWKSTEAKALFAPGLGVEDVRSELWLRVHLLDDALSKPDNYRLIVPNMDFENKCSDADKFKIRAKAQVLRTAYEIALDEIDKPECNWRTCCQKAIDQTKNCATKNPEILMRWNRSFRKQKIFPHPNRYAAIGKRQLPPALDDCPEFVNKIHLFCRENLNTLTVELLHEHIKNILPDIEDTSCPAVERFKENPPSRATVDRWMNALEYTYGVRKKTYYVDNHENPMNQFDRREYCTEFLKLEGRAHRWIQISHAKLESILSSPEDEHEKSFARTFVPWNHGYSYVNETTGEQMREYHVDDHDYFMMLGNSAPNGYGGYLSVRKNPDEKPVLLWGQDETVIHQNRFSTKQWATPDGRVGITQKSDGYSKMISGIQCREFGYGFPMTKEQLDIVNAFRRRESSQYKDTAAAEEVFGKIEKEDLKSSPFSVMIEPGKNDDGYWDYNHMVLQMEDCWDVANALLPQFDHIFLFDASSGHRKKREDGLDAREMSMKFGGSQPKMRDTVIMDDYYPFEHKDGSPVLKQGNTQRMVFRETDEGPFWLTPEERIERRFSQYIPDPDGKTRDKTKQEMYDDLNAKPGVNMKSKFLNKYTHTELKDLCRKEGIDTEKVKGKCVNGWVDQPKGLLQILWERGWIDEDSLSEYSLLKKDEDGNLDEFFSLKFLMASCKDFVEEQSKLQYIGSLYGMRVWLTPKYHAEIAGCGIEYSWGAVKSSYRKIGPDEKKGRDGFAASIDKAMSILTLETVRKCDRHARSYICAYYVLEVLPRRQNGDSSSERTDGAPEVESVTYAKIEKLKKAFKTHRCALDFDASFCASFDWLDN